MHREFLSILPVFSSLEVQARNGEGYREETALARSIYLAESPRSRNPTRRQEQRA